jgi:DNA-binding transcriptional MerR regulator
VDNIIGDRKDMPMTQEFYTISEFAERIGRRPRTVVKWIKCGAIACFQAEERSQRLIHHSELERIKKIAMKREEGEE